MKSIAVVYTSMGGLVGTMKGLLTAALPDHKIINIADDSLIRDVIAAGAVTAQVKERLFHYFAAAESAGPELVISACSSVGAAAEEYASRCSVPLVRVDHAMICRALGLGKRIGVLASLSTTMEPTKDYIYRLAASMGETVRVTGVVAEGAYQANAAGDREKHDALLLSSAEALRGQVDAVVLAQGSMAKMEDAIQGLLQVPVLSSPGTCVEEIVSMLREREGECG